MMTQEILIEDQNDSLVAVFYDDELSTIEEHMSIARDLGIAPLVPKSVPDLYETIRRYGDGAAYFLDMHVPNVSDLGAIDITRISTRSGSAFGTAIYKAIAETTTLRLNHAHVLSGRAMDVEAMQILSELEDEGLVVEEVDKEDISFFIERIENYKRQTQVDSTRNLGKGDQNDSVEVEAIRKIFADFADDPDELTAAALGLAMRPGGSFSDIFTHVKDALELKSTDIRTRIDLILYIKECISRAFGESNIAVQRAWMNSPVRILRDRSPIEVIRSRDVNNVAMLAAVVERAIS